VSGQLANLGLRGWVLVQLRVFVEVVDIVAHSEELLLVVGSCQKDGSDTHYVTCLNLCWVRSFALYAELMLNVLTSKTKFI
jgi:hypothetical protein